MTLYACYHLDDDLPTELLVLAGTVESADRVAHEILATRTRGPRSMLVIQPSTLPPPVMPGSAVERAKGSIRNWFRMPSLKPHRRMAT